MNVGGIHIIFGLGFLLITILLTTVYAYFGYIIIVSLQKLLSAFYKLTVFSENNRKKELDEDKKVEKSALKYWNKKVLYLIIISTTIILSTVYINQRIYWMGSGTAHYKAKEYFVAGQPAFGIRRIAELISHPENPLLFPYTKLQEVIFKKGSSFLPAEDGESSVWKNKWFYYLYTRASRRPYGVDSFKPAPKMVQLLDEIWATIEQMATKPYACKKTKRDYLLAFPNLANYYNTHDGHYKGKFYDAGELVRGDPILMKRVSLILKWLDELDIKWDSNNFRTIVNKKYPSVVAFKFILELRIIQDTLLSKSLNNQFSCQDPLLERLHKMYKDAMSDDIQRNPFLLYKRKNSGQAKILYESALYSTKGFSGKYFLEEICGRLIPKEKYIVLSRSDIIPSYPDGYIERVYKKELKAFINGDKND